MYCQTANGTVCRNDQTLHCHWEQAGEASVISSLELGLLRLAVEHPLLISWGSGFVTGSLPDGYRQCLLRLEQFGLS